MAIFHKPKRPPPGVPHWKPCVLDTGDKAYQLHLRYSPCPILIARRQTGYGEQIEWVVYARGCVVGATPEWSEAETLALSTWALMEASDG